MKVTKILSMRDIRKEAFRDVVYEWEDCISCEHGIEIQAINESNLFISRALYKLFQNKLSERVKKNRKTRMAFLTLVPDVNYIKGKNCLPVFIDIWNYNLDLVGRTMGNTRPYVVTSLDVLRKIKEKFPDSNVSYMPLMISDKWKSEDVPVKEIDVVQMGRRNQVLHEYMLQYISAHPDVEYIYSEQGKSNGNLNYISTKYKDVEKIETRDEYMNLLKRAKISLVSSPGVDNSRKRAEDIDFPTPRFYESAINYCYMLGRYSDHVEFEKQEINKVCDNIVDFEQFEQLVDLYLSSDIFIHKATYDEFIKKHLTSTWINELFYMMEK